MSIGKLSPHRASAAARYIDPMGNSESSNRKTMRVSASVAKLPQEGSIIHEIRSSAV